MPADELLGRRIIAAVRLARYERAVERALLLALAHQLDRALAKLRTVVADAVPSDIFDEASWTDELERTVAPTIDGIFAEIEADAARFFTGPGALPEIDLTHRLDRLLGAMRGLSPDLSRRLGETLTEGVNKGESIDKLSARVRETFGVGQSRARLIARTETVGAANGASDDAVGALVRGGVAMEKTWLATLDGRTRPTHTVANGQTVPYDQPFKVGTHELMFPGDPGGPVEEIANCRCTTLYDEAREAPAPQARFEMSDMLDPMTGSFGAELADIDRMVVALKRATSAIGRVHRAPNLLEGFEVAARRVPEARLRTPGLRVQRSSSLDPGEDGHFDPGGQVDGEPAIRVGSNSAQPDFTLVHELGHFFDFGDLEAPGQYQTWLERSGGQVPSPALAKWRAAVKASDAIQTLQREFDATPTRYVGYLLDPREIWARSYVQWISLRSGDERLLGYLRQWQGSPRPAQWADDDFGPIGEALDELFAGLGLTA